MVDFLHVTTTTSTNADVLTAFGNGLDPRPVLADYQTAGRGRLGRLWHSDSSSPMAQSMLGSIPQRWETDEAGIGLVPFAAGMATIDALEQLSSGAAGGPATPLRLGWPNDVIVHSGDRWRKLAGILVESVPLDRTTLGVVVGVGVNLTPVRQTTDPAISHRAISLAELGVSGIMNTQIFRALLVTLDTRTTELRCDPSGFMDEYRSRCATIGESVQVQLSGGLLGGRAEDVLDSGQLVVLDPTGERHEISVGDVVIRATESNPDASE